MGRIHLLPASVVNQIAAGEVIERPASVVKELLENAVDSGAQRIELAVERGGRDLVRVADDGCGMEREDLPLAFSPHCTSKLLTADDLYQVRTLGFRGEALAAIAEVARVRCQSRPRNAETGFELSIEAGVAGDVRPCASPFGTVVEVRNLFFNTPVRRGFLKSDSTEAAHVTEAFTRVALGHPEIGFVFRSGNRTVHELSSSSGLKERIATFFGQELADALIWVESRSGDCSVKGYVAHPAQSRSSPKSQFLFLHGRAVRDRSLQHALSEAYRGLLMTGRYPVAFLMLDLPPEEVDVNVHPCKVEVRFRDSQRVYSQVLATIRRTFLASDLHARLQAGGAAPVEPVREMLAPVTNETLQADVPITSALSAGAIESPFELSAGRDERQMVAEWFTPGMGTGPSHRASGSGASTSGALATPPPRTPSPPAWVEALPPRTPRSVPGLFDELQASDNSPALGPGAGLDGAHQELAGIQAPEIERGPDEIRAESRISAAPECMKHPLRAIQIHDSYLVVETPDGLELVDQHALHERILFEELRKRIDRGNLESQRLLVPEPLALTPREASAAVDHRDAFLQLGFEVEPFGGNTILIHSVPALLDRRDPIAVIRDLVEHLSTESQPPSRDALLQDLLATMACKAAVKAGDPLRPDEIEALLARRHLAENSHHCPHGRPSSLRLTRGDLEKQFGRLG
jgi:DNA mismatch repair protein MutL